jgi:aspartate/methionine/tyrosine aminotransferase
MLQVLRENRDSSDGLVLLHTLSKRSCAGGLRCGQIAGDPAWVARYAEFNRGCGVSTSWPACEAAAALWADESHVEILRDQVQCNWDIADELLSDR